MDLKRTLLYALANSVTFLLLHMLVVSLKLTDMVNFILIIAAMVLTQLSAFMLSRRRKKRIAFKNILILLAITQIMSVTLLTMYSAYWADGERKPVIVSDVLVSLLLFAVMLPLIVSSVIQFIFRSRKTH